MRMLLTPCLGNIVQYAIALKFFMEVWTCLLMNLCLLVETADLFSF